MNKLIKSAISERKVTILFSIFILIYGFYSYYYMPRQENPDLASPAVIIVTPFPGASAESVEKLVTSKIEDKLAQLDGVDFIESYSQDNASIIFCLLKTNVDYDVQWDKLRTEIDDLKPNFPEAVQSPEINTDLTDTAGIIISLSSTEYDSTRLADFAEDYKDRMSLLDGIKRVDINGIRKNRIEIEIIQEKLDPIGVSISDIHKLLRAQNLVIPAGSIQTDNGKINVNVPESFEKLQDFKDLVVSISPETGAMVKLKDVANISIKEVESDNYYIKDGKASVLITAYFETDKNVVLIGENVRKEIDKLRPIYPDTLDIDEVLFLPEDVKLSVNSFILNLFEGIIFVIIIIFIGMGIRNALVVSLAIPMSIAMTFIYMFQSGVKLQQVSISALIIALGMLVDNAIVISDAIQVHINEGLSKKEAAFRGAREQALPIFTSTLTTVAAFSPLMGLPGSAGEFVSSLPLVVIVSLSASFFVAMFVTPSISSLFLKSRTKAIDPLKSVQKAYTKLMRINISKPVISLGITAIILGSTIWLGITQIEVKMFPYVDKDWVYVNISNEVIGDIEKTEELVLEADRMLHAYPEITDTINSVGGGLPRYYMMADYMMPAESNGLILAKFDLSESENFHQRDDFMYELQKKFDAEFVGGYATAKLLEINIPGPNIDVRISGKDSEELDKIAEPLYQWMLKRDETMNVQKRKSAYKYRYRVNVDDEKALRLGLNKYEIQNQLNIALNGSKAGTLTTGTKSFEIFVISDIDDIDDIRNLYIKSSITGNKVPLRSFASVELEKSIDSIYRYDRQPFINVTADVRPGHGSIQGEVEKYISSLDTSAVTVNYGGDQKTMDLYLSGLYKAAIVALAIIYLILLVQFNSLSQPFIILITIPLAFIGIVIALILTKTNFTFTVGLGAASLMGVVVNNGILLIEYINRARKDGLEVKEACIRSVERRVRPILLSSITTIFGLIPLALGNSAFFPPMAIALMGGLITATFMTVTVVPTLYFVVASLDSRPKN